MSGEVTVFNLMAFHNRESFVSKNFAIPVEFKTITYNALQSHGTSPVTAMGMAIPSYPTEWLSSMDDFDTLSDTTVSTSSSTEVTMIDNKYFFLPVHGALKIPVGRHPYVFELGIVSSSGSYTCHITERKLELVKIAANGTVTVLVSATDATNVTTTSTTFAQKTLKGYLDVTSEQSIADGERLAMRITTKGKQTGGGIGYHCLNAGGGSNSAPTLGTDRTRVLLNFGG